MSFLHVWAIPLGLLLAGLPVAIHWLTRPRPVRLPLSTLRFIREVVQQRKTFQRLRDWIILGLRALAVVCLAWAIARPLSARQALTRPDDGGDVARVVILDVSQSLGAVQGGITNFERARPLAAGYLADQPGLQANLILAGAAARPVFDRLSTNLPALREELARVQVRPERLQLEAAVNQAAELLSRAGDQRRHELIVVSDFQRANWAAADFSALPEDTVIYLESVAGAEPLPNLAVLRVAGSGRAELGREARLEVELGNFSATPRQVEVEIVAGDTVSRHSALCQPWGKTTVATELPTRSSGWQAGEVRLLDVQDALPLDNVRPFVLEVRPPPTFALLTRQPATQRPSSSYYLERALLPIAPRQDGAGSRVLRFDPSTGERESLAVADVLVLDHPGKLTPELIQFLGASLGRGRGILYAAAEPVDATNLQQLADAVGTALQMPVQFTPAPGGQRRRDLFLAEVQRDRPPWTIFGDTLTAQIGPLRFAGGLSSRRLEGALADDIAATYSDRSACLVVTSCGAGTLVVLNADLAATNLPASPVFVPLVGELADRLLGRGRSADAAACGEPLAVYLPPGAGPATGLRVLGPDRQSDAGSELREEKGSVLWRSSRLDGIGVYRVQRDDTPVYSVAAALPAEECDLRTLEPAVLQERLAGGRTVHFRSVAEAGDERDYLWVWLAVACVLCLLAEVVALRAFRT
jgi:hypothetical protein